MDERSAKFELDRLSLLRLRKLGIELKHIFDAGASDGAWSEHMLADFRDSSFELFEPLVDHVPELRPQIETRLAGARFKLHAVALGAQSKAASMYMYPENLRGSTALELTAKPAAARVVQVQMLTADDAISRLALPVPDLIKMDTQGCELNILQGARQTLPKVKALLLECWLVRGYGPATPLLLEIAEFLRQYDFHFWDFTGQWRAADDSLGAQDCVFLNARCPESPLKTEPMNSRRSEPPSPAAQTPQRTSEARWL